MFSSPSRGRKVYVGVRSMVAVAAILYFGGMDEFLAMGREARGVAATVSQAQSDQQQSMKEDGEHGNDN